MRAVLLILFFPLHRPLRRPLGGIFAVIFASFTLQWAAPDLNCKLQIAVGSAAPQQGAGEWRGLRRTSTTDLPSGVGSAGPRPGICRAEWAAPDLSRQKKNTTRDVRKYAGKIPLGISAKESLRVPPKTNDFFKQVPVQYVVRMDSSAASGCSNRGHEV